jgi:Ring finger domain
METRVSSRLLNASKWLLFMIESIVFIVVPSEVCLPFSTGLLLDPERIETDTLTTAERREVRFTIVTTGLASVFALFGWGFGSLGQFSPRDLFGNNLLLRILEARHGSVCCICQERHSLTGVMKVLPCDHAFHPPCIDAWLRHSDSCPLCKEPAA